MIPGLRALLFRIRPTDLLVGTAALLILFLASIPVQGGTLLVRGPAGAQMFLNGDPAGRLPWTDIVEIEEGSHELRAELKGHYDYETAVVVGPGEVELQLDFTMEPLSRTGAMARSLLLAGLGQRYVGRQTTGWALTLAEVLGVVGYAAGEFVVQSKKTDFEEAQRDYRNSVDEDEIVRLRAAAEAALSDLDSAKSIRDTGAALALGAVAVSVLDVLIRFPGVDAGMGTVPWSIGRGEGDPTSAHVAWSFSF